MFPSLVRGNETMFRSAGAKKTFLEVAVSINISPLVGRRATMFCCTFRVGASGVASRWLVHSKFTGAYSEVAAARLFRCSLRVRVEKKLAYLAGHIAGDGALARPRQRLVHIGSFQYPETAHMLLGLDVWPIGDEHRTISLLPHRLCVAGRGNSASELPGAGSDHFAVERVDLLDHRFGYGGRVEVVGKVISNQILWHDFFSLFSVVCFRWFAFDDSFPVDSGTVAPKVEPRK